MIHIFVSSSAAGTFRQMLRSRNIREDIIDLSEDLSFGPISHGSLEERGAWLDHHMPLTFGRWEGLGASEERFVNAIAHHRERLFWLAPASAVDQAGLYWYLSKIGGEHLQLALVHNDPSSDHSSEPLLSIGMLGLDAQSRMYDKCIRTQWQGSNFAASHWDKLIADQARLRIVEAGKLKSVADDHFDSFLLVRCPADWGKWRSVIGYTMCDLWDTGHWVSDHILIWRLRTLIHNGQIVAKGKLPEIGESASRAAMIKRA